MGGERQLHEEDCRDARDNADDSFLSENSDWQSSSFANMANAQMVANHAYLNIACFTLGNSSNSHYVRKIILEINDVLLSE